MYEFSLQGELSIAGTTFFIVPPNCIYKIFNIRFNNPAAYTLTLAKYDGYNLINIYTLNLSAGDTITDNFVYYLEPNQYIVATSSVPGTSYILNGSKFTTS